MELPDDECKTENMQLQKLMETYNEPLKKGEKNSTEERGLETFKELVVKKKMIGLLQIVQIT